MFKQILFSAVLITVAKPALTAEVMPWNNVADIKCRQEFNHLLSKNEWDKESYRQQVSGAYNKTAYRNLSKKIGEWVEVQLVSKKSPEVLQVKDNTLTRFSFDKNCQMVSGNETWPWHIEEIFAKKSPEDWSDDDLRAQVASGKKGMIYYWSPRFVYSVYDLPRAEKLASQFGYEFVAVVDPRASKEEVLGALEVMQKKLKIKNVRNLASTKAYNRNVSIDLFMRSAFNHFPIVYIYNNKKIHSRWITGIMTDKGLETMAETFSSELK